MTPLSAPLVVVLGASGGLGASTWAATLAWRLSLHLGECVLVDGDVRGGGLDMTCGTEHVPGLRWADLARLRGAASCARLLAALPCGEVPLLSAGGSGAPVPDSAVLDVVGSLRGEVPVVVDARVGAAVTSRLLEGADAVHVVTGLRARQLADAEALLAGLATGSGGSAVGLVTRGERAVTPELAEVIEHLARPHLAHLRDDARVRRDGERGDWPGLRGALRDRADSVALDLVERRGQGAA
ncbi:hypothetical protein GCM10022415_18370 [Knoellia locipacati]|uniref:CobQ/CobB/MinD/ParA nucleotide binding domain-containing protein n=1 Tax=Knoellia locipacati TaxID=882824 RepID=A0A512T0Q5_9MICO|nr:hypothetical protein [Knoellia locipacati]GEQ13785.1 hypothetical protein KLO01_18320 [Knoellia locipacati]